MITDAIIGEIKDDFLSLEQVGYIIRVSWNGFDHGTGDMERGVEILSSASKDMDKYNCSCTSKLLDVFENEDKHQIKRSIETRRTLDERAEYLDVMAEKTEALLFSFAEMKLDLQHMMEQIKEQCSLIDLMAEQKRQFDEIIIDYHDSENKTEVINSHSMDNIGNVGFENEKLSNKLDDFRRQIDSNNTEGVTSMGIGFTSGPMFQTRGDDYHKNIPQKVRLKSLRLCMHQRLSLYHKLWKYRQKHTGIGYFIDLENFYWGISISSRYRLRIRIVRKT